MEENGNMFAAFGIGVFIGAFLGAILALLFAPEAGEELRTKTQIELERLKQSEGSAPLESGVQDQSVASVTE